MEQARLMTFRLRMRFKIDDGIDRLAGCPRVGGHRADAPVASHDLFQAYLERLHP
jgi:hypothetical protein